MEVLSEHLCQGWLEGYLLTGRHGLFTCYEAFIHIIDAMFNQHAKWLKMTAEIPWRRPIASLNYLLTSHVWRQDHNGFSHQDPGFIDHVVNKKAEVIRVYLPPDTNTLLSTADHCLRSRDYVNVIVAGKQPALTYLSMDQATAHCSRGLGIWDWASNDGGEPDVVIAACGDVPTLEALAAVDILRQRLPELRVRFVNVVDLMRLQDEDEHPHGLSDRDFDAIFTKDRPIVFALPRLSMAHPSPHLSAHQPRQPARARLQGGGDRHHAVRHGHAQRPRPVPSGHRRHRSRHGARVDPGRPPPGPGRRSTTGTRLYARERRGSTRDPRLDLAVLTARPVTTGRVLVLNAGSATLKATVLDMPSIDPIFDRTVDWSWTDRLPPWATPSMTHSRRWSEAGFLADSLAAVGHRVVHGGERFTGPALIDDEALAELDAVADLAPIHDPLAIATIRVARARIAGAPCRGVRHGLPQDAAGARAPVSGARRLGHRSRHPTLRLPWPIGRLVGPPGGRLARSARQPATVRGRAPWRRMFGDRGGRRSVGRHIDGYDPARGADDGDALWLHRPRHRVPPHQGWVGSRRHRARPRACFRAARCRWHG